MPFHSCHLLNYVGHRLGLLVLQVLFRRYKNLLLGRSCLPNTLSPIDNPRHDPNPQPHLAVRLKGYIWQV